MASRAPDRCLLTTLPPELLHWVFHRLDATADVLAARQTCTLLAAVGLDHMPRQVDLLYGTGRLLRLVAMAAHPVVRRRVNSLYYQADRFPPQDFDRWRRRVRGDYTDAQLRTAFEAFEEAVGDQRRVAASALDLFCLTDFFRHCPKLDDVTLAFGAGTRPANRTHRLPGMPTRAWARTLIGPGGGVVMQDQGVAQFKNLARALSLAGTRLDSLTLSRMSHAFLLPQHRWPLTILAGLKRFRLEIGDGEWVDYLGPLGREMAACLGTGSLFRVLRAAPDLREVWLSFPWVVRDWDDEHMPFTALAPLRHIFGGRTWEGLRRIGLARVCGTAADYVSVLLRHRATLREVHLTDLALTDGEWGDVFAALAAGQQRLRKIRLRGSFYGPADDELRFSGARIDPTRDAIERAIVRGGVPERDPPAADPEDYP